MLAACALKPPAAMPAIAEPTRFFATLSEHAASTLVFANPYKPSAETRVMLNCGLALGKLVGFPLLFLSAAIFKTREVHDIVTIEQQIPDKAIMADGIQLYFKVRYTNGTSGLVCRDFCRLSETNDKEGPFPLTKEQVYPQYFARDKLKKKG